MARSKRNRGAVILEAAVGMLASVWALGLNVELVRRAQYEIVLHHAAFLAVRSRALGADWVKTRAKLRRFFERVSPGRADAWMRQVKIDEKVGPRGLELTLRIRFPSFFRFPLAGQTKHHFELSRACLFPWSF